MAAAAGPCGPIASAQGRGEDGAERHSRSSESRARGQDTERRSTSQAERIGASGHGPKPRSAAQAQSGAERGRKETAD